MGEQIQEIPEPRCSRTKFGPGLDGQVQDNRAVACVCWADSAGCGCARAISKEAHGSRGSAQRRGQGDEGPKAERWNGQCVDTST